MDEKINNLKTSEDQSTDNQELNNIPENYTPKETKEKLTFSDISEKVEDTVEDIMITIDETIYGDSHDFTHDIPAMMEMPDKPRKINKIQTKRNILNRLLGRKGNLILLAILGIAMIIGLIVTFIG